MVMALVTVKLEEKEKLMKRRKWGDYVEILYVESTISQTEYAFVRIRGFALPYRLLIFL